MLSGRYHDYITNVSERTYDENEDDIMLCEEETEAERKAIAEKLRYKDTIAIILLEKKVHKYEVLFQSFLDSLQPNPLLVYKFDKHCTTCSQAMQN